MSKKIVKTIRHMKFDTDNMTYIVKKCGTYNEDGECRFALHGEWARPLLKGSFQEIVEHLSKMRLESQDNVIKLKNEFAEEFI